MKRLSLGGWLSALTVAAVLNAPAARSAPPRPSSNIELQGLAATSSASHSPTATSHAETEATPANTDDKKVDENKANAKKADEKKADAKKADEKNKADEIKAPETKPDDPAKVEAIAGSVSQGAVRGLAGILAAKARCSAVDEPTRKADLGEAAKQLTAVSGGDTSPEKALHDLAALVATQAGKACAPADYDTDLATITTAMNTLPQNKLAPKTIGAYTALAQTFEKVNASNSKDVAAAAENYLKTKIDDTQLKQALDGISKEPSPPPSSDGQSAVSDVDAFCAKSNVLCLDKLGQLRRGEGAGSVAEGSSLVVAVVGCTPPPTGLSITARAIASPDTLFAPTPAPTTSGSMDRGNPSPCNPKDETVLSQKQFDVSSAVGDKSIEVSFKTDANSALYTLKIDHGRYYLDVALLVPIVPYGSRQVTTVALEGRADRQLVLREDTAVIPAFVLNVYPFGRDRGSLVATDVLQMFGFQFGIDLDITKPFDNLFGGVVFEVVNGVSLDVGMCLVTTQFVDEGHRAGGLISAQEVVTPPTQYALRFYGGVSFTTEILKTLLGGLSVAQTALGHT